MNNDLSWILDTTERGYMPAYFWYPVLARAETYSELARRLPSWTPYVAEAMMAGNYASAFDKLDLEPTEELFKRAYLHAHKGFLESLRQKCKERGMNHFEDPNWSIRTPLDRDYPRLLPTSWPLMQKSTSTKNIEAHTNEGEPCLYAGFFVDASQIELHASLYDTNFRPTDPTMLLSLDRLYFEMGQDPPHPSEPSEAYRSMENYSQFESILWATPPRGAVTTMNRPENPH